MLKPLKKTPEQRYIKQLEKENIRLHQALKISNDYLGQYEKVLSTIENLAKGNNSGSWLF